MENKWLRGNWISFLITTNDHLYVVHSNAFTALFNQSTTLVPNSVYNLPWAGLGLPPVGHQRVAGNQALCPSTQPWNKHYTVGWSVLHPTVQVKFCPQGEIGWHISMCSGVRPPTPPMRGGGVIATDHHWRGCLNSMVNDHQKRGV